MLYEALIIIASAVAMPAYACMSATVFVCVFLLTMGQRATIKFCVKNEMNATKMFEMVRKAYGETNLGRTTVFE